MNLDQQYRSRIFYAATINENLVGECIAWHFCPDNKKHLAFVALLFNRGEIPFSKKIEILEFIIKSDYPNLNGIFPDIFNRLNSFRRVRNKFAHAELVLDPNRMKDPEAEVCLKSINRNGQIVEERFNEADLRSYAENGMDLMWKLIYMVVEIRHQVKGGKPRTGDELWSAIEGDDASKYD